MSPGSPRREEIMVSDGHKLTRKCAKLCSDVFEVAAAASGGFVLTQSARRIIAEVVVLESDTPKENALDTDSEDSAAELRQ